VVGTLSPGAHPGGANGQDAYTGHLVPTWHQPWPPNGPRVRAGRRATNAKTSCWLNVTS